MDDAYVFMFFTSTVLVALIEHAPDMPALQARFGTWFTVHGGTSPGQPGVKPIKLDGRSADLDSQTTSRAGPRIVCAK